MATVSCTDGGGEDRAERRADAGRPGERERGAGDRAGRPTRRATISASGRHSRLSLSTNGVSRKNTPSAMITAPAILSSVPRESLQRGAEPGRGHAERDEDDGEGEAEDDRRHQHARQSPLAVLHLGQRDARDRRQVAGHERQHAWRDERDEADREGGDDRGVDAAVHRSKAASSASSRRASAGSSVGPLSAAGRRRRPAAPAPRREQRAERASGTRTPGRARRRASNPPPLRHRRARPARTRRRARALICALVLPSAIRRRISARSGWRRATGRRPAPSRTRRT